MENLEGNQQSEFEDQESVDDQLEYTDDDQADEDDEDNEGADEEEELYEVAGEQYTGAELAALVQKGKDYTKKTQELAQERERQKSVDPSEEERVNGMADKYGIVTEKKLKQMLQEVEVKKEAIYLKKKFNLSDDVLGAVTDLAKAKGMAPKEVFSKYFSARKVKVVGASSGRKGGSPSRANGTITAESISKMSLDEYEKNQDKIDAFLAGGQ